MLTSKIVYNIYMYVNHVVYVNHAVYNYVIDYAAH